MDADPFLHPLAGGAIIATALTFARWLLEYGFNAAERRLDRDDRRRRAQHDAAQRRLERVLQDRLAEADRRLERAEQETLAERVRCATLEHECATLEHEHARLLQAYERLNEQHARLQLHAAGHGHPQLPPGT